MRLQHHRLVSNPIHGRLLLAHQEHQAAHAAERRRYAALHTQAAVEAHCIAGLGHDSPAGVAQAEDRAKCYGWDRNRNFGCDGSVEAHHSPDGVVGCRSRRRV